MNELGFHVDLKGCEEFLKELKEHNVRTIKLHIDLHDKLEDVRNVIDGLTELNMRAYVSLFTIDQPEIKNDPIFPYLSSDRTFIYKRYEEVLRALRGDILGVSMIDHADRLIKVGSHVTNRSDGSFSRNDVETMQRNISSMISSKGFKAVLNCREEDILNNHWRLMGNDILDIRGSTRLKVCHGKPVIVTELRREGGFRLPLEQSKLVNAGRKIRGVDCAFLYSKKNCFEWKEIMREGVLFNEEGIFSRET